MDDPGFTNLSNFNERFPDEQACRDYLEKARWKGHITCPHCSADTIYKFADGKRYKCGSCRKQFTVKVGTIFEQSPLPLQKWLLAMYILTAHKKGIASTQLARDIGVTQKTAWFMLGRLRWVMRTKSFDRPLKNVVEADETYVGGKPRKKEEKRQRGRSNDRKAPVAGVVERNGELRMMPVPNVKAATLKSFLTANVDSAAVLLTDSYNSYVPVGKSFAVHESVNHAQGEYVRYREDGLKVHTNTIEGAFSMLKRGIIGIYHHVSREHLHRYCAEFDYRYNTRKMKDSERFVRTLSHIEDRLTYKELVAYGCRAAAQKASQEGQGTSKAFTKRAEV